MTTGVLTSPRTGKATHASRQSINAAWLGMGQVLHPQLCLSSRVVAGLLTLVSGMSGGVREQMAGIYPTRPW